MAAARADNAIKVHRSLGPGPVEFVDQVRLEYELESASLEVRCEVPLPNRYGEIRIEAGDRLDMLVDEGLIIDDWTVDRLLLIHATQPLTHLRLANRRPGFLLNWNAELMKDGVRRFVTD